MQPLYLWQEEKPQGLPYRYQSRDYCSLNFILQTERVAEEGGPVANTDNKPLPLHPSMVSVYTLTSIDAYERYLSFS